MASGGRSIPCIGFDVFFESLFELADSRLGHEGDEDSQSHAAVVCFWHLQHQLVVTADHESMFICVIY